MDKNIVLVSVLIPVYNVENYIDRCVRSLFEQTYQNIEYIFVDDCSTDNSINILQKILEEYPDRKIQTQIITHKKNKGSATARNSGLNLAKGKYLMFADSDDYTDKHWVEYLLNHAENTKSDIVFCDYYDVYDSTATHVNQPKREKPIDYIQNMYSTGNLWSKIYKKKLFEENSIKFPDGLDVMEDYRTNIKLFYFAKNIEHIPKPLYYYVRTRNESLTGHNHKKSLSINTDMIENIKVVESFCIEKNIIHELELELGLLKIVSKNNILINSNSVKTLKTWKNIFPESNKYLLKSNLPSYYKIVAISSIYNIWVIPRIWFMIKRIKNKLLN